MKFFKLFFIFIIIGFFLVSCSSSEKALDTQQDKKSDYQSGSESTMGKMSYKMVRGIVNVATSPFELPKQMVKTSVNESVFVGCTVGIFKGVGMIVTRALAGVFDTAFFLSPWPDDYKPILEPAYIIE